MATFWLGKLLVIAVLVGVFLIGDTHARPHGKNGRKHSRERHGSVEELFQLSCRATDTSSGSLIRDVTCPDEQQCIMGPLPMTINNTDISALYCDGFKHPPVFPKGKKQPRGLCLVESEQGTTLFLWGCKGGDDCQYGPVNITFNDQEAEAHFCRDPKSSESSEESNEDSSKESNEYSSEESSEDSSEEKSRHRGAGRRRRPRSAEGRQRRRHQSSEEDSSEENSRSTREDNSREDHTHSPNLPAGGRPRGLAQRVNQGQRPGRPGRHSSEESSEENDVSDEDHTESPNHLENPDRSEGRRPQRQQGRSDRAHSRRVSSLRNRGRGRRHDSSEEDSREDHTHSPENSHEDHTRSPTQPERPRGRRGNQRRRARP